MKISLIPIISLWFTITSQSQTTLPTNPEQYFDFWLGKWDAVWDEGEGKKGKGRNHITKILNGKVIEENFEILEGQNKGFQGMSISAYHAQFKTWKQSWADNQGTFYYFKGEFEDNKRIFRTETFDTKDGKKFTQRMVFYNITKNSMTWDWESSTDGGSTWKLNWRIFYTKSKE